MKRWSITVLCFALGIGFGWYVAAPTLRGQAPTAPAAPREPTSFRDVVKKVLPAVVSIDVQSVRRPPRRLDAEGPNQIGLGSGFIVDAKGVIVTNYHVVDGAERVEVTLPDGRRFISKDIKADPKSDLAVVRVETKDPLPFLRLGDSDAMEMGDRVLAFGAPFGLTGSVTAGIVSAKSRALRINTYEDFIQTDAAINPGNSGGPLVNLDGEVVGINSAIKSKSGGFQGVGLAISSNMVKNVTEQLLRNGEVHRGYLGVWVKEIDSPEAAARLGLDRARGVLVTEVYADSPAVRAGLRKGDVLLKVNGKTLADSLQLTSVIAGLPLGKPVDVAIVREGKPATVRVKIEQQPDDFDTSPAPGLAETEIPRNAVKLAKVGVEAADLTPELAARLGYRDGARGGAVIVRVQQRSVAAQAGLRPGLLITRVDGQMVATAAALAEALAGTSVDRGVVLKVHAPDGGKYFVLLKSGE
jgi:serine protease Do